jgi:uncharacterized membrane protein YfcA
MMLYILGIIGAVAIGLSLGLLGAGGGILAIPLLVYFFEIPFSDATGHSQVIVALASAWGVIRAWKKGTLKLGLIRYFVLVSVLSTFIARRWIAPAIPPHIQAGTFTWEKDTVLMTLFSIILFLAGFKMWASDKQQQVPAQMKLSHAVLSGVTAGMLTGIFGAGGGFLIVPALVLWGGLTMHEATGTSLAVIMLNTTMGALSGWSLTHWHIQELIIIALATTVGMVIGFRLSGKFHSAQLKKIFGLFLWIVAVAILVKEIFF